MKRQSVQASKSLDQLIDIVERRGSIDPLSIRLESARSAINVLGPLSQPQRDDYDPNNLITDLTDDGRSSADGERIPNLFEERLTHSIIGSFFDVYNYFGFGLLESVYANALAADLRAKGRPDSRSG